MSKKEVQEYLTELARQCELPSGDKEEEDNWAKGHLYPDLSEEMCDILSKELCEQEEAKLAADKEAQRMFEEGDREDKDIVERREVERLSLEASGGVVYFPIDESDMASSNDTCTTDSSEDPAVAAACTKQACTNGCPNLGRVYDSLPMLMRS